MPPFWKTPLPIPAAHAARGLVGRLERLAAATALFDPVLQQECHARLDRITEELDSLVRQELRFSHTETWRSVYERVLDACQTKRYLSVALVRTDDYWADAPGRASLAFNFELARRGFYVHRRFLVDDYYWPPGASRPSGELTSVAREHAAGGIDVSLVRLSALDAEPDLARDFGVYGERAAGYQTLDDQGRTAQYVLRFGARAVEEGVHRWRQLDLYARSLDEVLDRLA